MHLSRYAAKPEDLLAVLVLFGALTFRLATFPCARFAGDEAWQWSMALATARFEVFPVLGLPVTGQHVRTPGGLYHMLMAVPLRISPSPLAAGAFVVALNVAAMVLGWRLLRAQYGPRPALGAVLVAAVNPFWVFLGDRLWNPGLLVPIGMLWLFLLWKGLREGGWRPWVGLAALLVVSPQVHLSPVHLVLLTLAVLCLARPRLPWKALLLGACLGLVTYLPYVVVDGLNGFENTRGLFAHVAAARAPLGEVWRALYYQVLYACGDMTYQVAKGSWYRMTEWDYLTSAAGRQQYADLLGLPGAGGWALVSGLLAGLLLSLSAHLHLVVETVRDGSRGLPQAIARDPLASAAVLNLPLLFLSFLLARKDFHPHYTILVFPLAMVAIAKLLAALPQRWSTAAVAVLALVALTHGVLVARYYAREEAPVSALVAVKAARVIGRDARGRPVAVEFWVPRTRVGADSITVLAARLWGTPIQVEGNSATRYIILPAGNRAIAGATAAWDLEKAVVLRYGPAP